MALRIVTTRVTLLLVAILPTASIPSASPGFPTASSACVIPTASSAYDVSELDFQKAHSASDGTLTASQEPTPPHSSHFEWPTGQPVAVLRAFDPPQERWQAGHRGVDLSIPPGSPVYAAGAGIVVYAGPIAGRGVVSIEHSGGLRTTYEPLAVDVTRGDTVNAGEQIGVLTPGHTGDALHWGAKNRNGDYVNPLLLLEHPRFRLWR